MVPTQRVAGQWLGGNGANELHRTKRSGLIPHQTSNTRNEGQSCLGDDMLQLQHFGYSEYKFSWPSGSAGSTSANSADLRSKTREKPCVRKIYGLFSGPIPNRYNASAIYMTFTLDQALESLEMIYCTRKMWVGHVPTLRCCIL